MANQPGAEQAAHTLLRLPGWAFDPGNSDVLSARVIGRISSALFMLCGALVSLMAPLLPFQVTASRWGLLGVGLAAATTGAIIWFLPWNKWGRPATIGLVPVAMTLVGWHNYFTGYDGFLYGLFFMVIFVWIGLGHPQGWSLACAPMLAVAYLLPMAFGGHHPAIAFGSAGYALPACVLTGETVSWVSNRLRRAEAALRSSEERFRSLVEESADVVVVFDPQGLVTFVSASLEPVLGYEPRTWIGQNPADCLHPADRDLLGRRWEDIIRSPDTIARADVRVVAADGSWRWCALVLRNLLSDPSIAAVVANFTDITERVQLEVQLRHQAFHDPLTNLANRVLLADRIGHALARSERSQEEVAVILFDLDGFKTVNDSLGHSIGDRLLQKVSERLLANLRSGDTAARLGGDEFAVLVEGSDAFSRARTLAEQLITTLAAPLTLPGREVVVKASFGLAVPDTDQPTSAEELLRNADVAMYRAKAAGKGGLAIFEAHMHAAALARLELDAELRTALAQEQFVLHYQPLVGLPHWRLEGVEALIRWNHPTRGPLPPNEFITLAEETGLVVEIGQWVLDTACHQLADWQASGGPARVAVNLSARQLSAPGFIDGVAAALGSSGADPARLTLELTESLLMADTVTVQSVLEALRRLGVRIALDDFGTGYSSLSYLHQFPIDCLKVDKSFVGGLGTSDGDASVVAGIVGLASALGLIVVAEGVETAAQAQLLADLGCEMAQGFFFGRPMPAEDLARHWFLAPHQLSGSEPHAARPLSPSV
ncbi:MAG TPA: EAL domain-containing protein [Acidimicrobiales bacterium]|nr:EAL domain-containing protein [Acidimicrobiales bacterium]